MTGILEYVDVPVECHINLRSTSDPVIVLIMYYKNHPYIFVFSFSFIACHILTIISNFTLIS